MDNKRFIEILQTKKCSEEERNEFMATLANGKHSELSDIIVSHYNYENNMEKVVEYIFETIGGDVNKFYCNVMTVDDYHNIVDNHNHPAILRNVFGAIDEYPYVIVDAYDDVIEYDTIGEVISDFLIEIDFFSNICEEDFESIIDEINDHDMFYSELE